MSCDKAPATLEIMKPEESSKPGGARTGVKGVMCSNGTSCRCWICGHSVYFGIRVSEFICVHQDVWVYVCVLKVKNVDSDSVLYLMGKL